MEGKHAYLIMAHAEPELLTVLLSMLDDSRNDIFLHVDKKSALLDCFTPPRIKTCKTVRAGKKNQCGVGKFLTSGM